jgi:hypothetical protein
MQIEHKQILIKMWFDRIYDYINILESEIRYMDVKTYDYKTTIKNLETQFENIRIIKKVLNNDAYIQGFNHKLLNKN